MKSKPVASDVVEEFLLFRRVAFRRDWGLFEPVLGRNGRPTDARLITIRNRLSSSHSEQHRRLFNLLDSMGRDERTRLRRLIRKTNPCRQTSLVFDEIEKTYFQCVCDFACVELMHHEMNKERTEVLARRIPVARNLLIDLLYSRLISSLSKLLDPATSAGKQTGSLEGLIRMIEADGFIRFASRSRKRLGRRPKGANKGTGIRRGARNILKARNKYVAHIDAQMLLDKRRMAFTRIIEFRETITSIGAILDDYSLSVLAQDHRHDLVTGADLAVTQLIRVVGQTDQSK